MADVFTVLVGVHSEDEFVQDIGIRKMKEVLKVAPEFDINTRSIPNGTTALCIAVQHRWYKIALFLLDKGADPTIVDNKGNSPSTIIKSNDKNRVFYTKNKGKIDAVTEAIELAETKLKEAKLEKAQQYVADNTFSI